MNRSITLSAMLSLPILCAAQTGTINNVLFNPVNPNECQLVNITVTGTTQSGISIDNFNIGQTGNTIEVTLNCSGGGGGQAPFSQLIPPIGPYPAGAYVFQVRLLHVPSNTVMATQNVNKTIAVGQNPNVGTQVNIPDLVCTAAPAFQLISLLAGADPGGVWTDPNGQPSNGTFIPGTSPQGSYNYTILALPPCQSASVDVIVVYIPNSNPGTNGFAQTCAGNAPFDLFPFLGGTPQTNGSWFRPGGQSFNGIFDPSSDPAGAYRYEVPTTEPGCPNPFATVTVSYSAPNNAGTGITVSVCESDTLYALSGALTGNPQPTGTWFDPDGFVMGGYTAEIIPQVNPDGVYTYVVTSVSCPPDSAFATIVYIAEPCDISVQEVPAGLTRFEVSPNPTQGTLFLDLAAEQELGHVELQVIDLSGRQRASRGLQGVGTAHQRITLDVSGLAAGMYTLRLVTDRGVAARPFVRQ